MSSNGLRIARSRSDDLHPAVSLEATVRLDQDRERGRVQERAAAQVDHDGGGACVGGREQGPLDLGRLIEVQLAHHPDEARPVAEPLAPGLELDNRHPTPQQLNLRDGHGFTADLTPAPVAPERISPGQALSPGGRFRSRWLRPRVL